jgi:hypothetical protein
MKSNSHGQQRSQDQNKTLCSFGYPALCCIAETDGDSDIRPPAAQGQSGIGMAVMDVFVLRVRHGGQGRLISWTRCAGRQP